MVAYDPCKKHEILDIMIKCMQRVVDESPSVYKEYSEMMLKMFKQPNREGVWPETFFIMSNRVGGKTYSISKMILYMAMDYDVKFGLHCRTQTQLGKLASGIMHRVIEDVYSGYHMSEKVISKFYSEIWMNGPDEEKKLVGYVLPMNSDSKLKDVSSVLSDIEIMFMDEFQSSDSVPGETDKFVNIHDTVARGVSRDGINYGVRYLPTILCSNSLSITNRYLALFKLMNKIQDNTKLYKGDGVSLLRFKNKNVADNQSITAFHKSIAGNKMLDSNIDNAWLNDDKACVCKPDGWGQSYYIGTIIDGSDKYGVSFYPAMDYYYMGRKVDQTDKNVYNITPGGAENVPLLRKANVFVALRSYYEKGLCRFSDQSVKGIMEKIYR